VRGLSDDALRAGLRELVAHDRITTVRLLIHLGEFDSRRLYRQDGFPCMKDYCVAELKMSEDVAYKRITAARRARRFPRILVALNEGALTLTAVAMVSRYLTDENAVELLAEAERKTSAQVAELVARWFPRPDLPTLVQPLAWQPQAPVPTITAQVVPESSNCQELAARRVESPVIATRVMPLAPERHGVQFTISQSDRDLLRRAQDLVSPQLPSRDEGEIFVRALRVYVAVLEKRKFALTDEPRKTQLSRSENPRYVPAHVKRAVHRRDGGRCTFVAENGRRCQERAFLEFDHKLEVARGGKATIENVRLRCKAHNQLAAEGSFGEMFMRGKVELRRSQSESDQC